jgi:hypothetical protein
MTLLRLKAPTTYALRRDIRDIATELHIWRRHYSSAITHVALSEVYHSNSTSAVGPISDRAGSVSIFLIRAPTSDWMFVNVGRYSEHMFEDLEFGASNPLIAPLRWFSLAASK